MKNLFVVIKSARLNIYIAMIINHETIVYNEYRFRTFFLNLFRAVSGSKDWRFKLIQLHIDDSLSLYQDLSLDTRHVHVWF